MALQNLLGKQKKYAHAYVHASAFLRDALRQLRGRREQVQGGGPAWLRRGRRLSKKKLRDALAARRARWPRAPSAQRASACTWMKMHHMHIPEEMALQRLWPKVMAHQRSRQKCRTNDFGGRCDFHEKNRGGH